MKIRIRESTAHDKEAIKKIHLGAFDSSENEVVAQLALDLLEDPTARPMLSLVAEEYNQEEYNQEEYNQVVANIIFTSVNIQGDNQDLSIYILAPLAVAKNYQAKGIGTKLIKHGLEILKQHGADIVLVLGDPNYYSRSGFTATHNLKPPYQLEYPEAWMALELSSGVLDKTHGTVQCAASLSAKELW